ncbi:MAG TPA: glycosyltransferase family 4 protein [Ensifer sp.]|nr:glycosyltransferase family 4 protein [Ensifer sp.]
MTKSATAAETRVIAPNFKRRLSGVTSTIVQLVPEQNRQGQHVAVLGPGLPEHLPHLGWFALLSLWKRPRGGGKRVWHARRNNEMLFGLLLRDVLRMPVRLLFTSAAQRNHSRYTRWLIARMDAVVATSARSGSFLKVPHTVVSHGVDLALFHPPSDDSDTLAATDLPGKYLVGCFGRVRHSKGTDLFVRAMIELLPRYPDWTAIVTGRVTPDNKPFASKLEADIKAAGLGERIRILGEVDDIKPWYRRLTLYVAPSRNEGFGLTPLEAMASKTAVVASDAGAYAGMIVPGKTGEIAPAGDYETLRDAIAKYLANPAMAEAHGEAALDDVHARFDLKGEAAALGAIYETLSKS